MADRRRRKNISETEGEENTKDDQIRDDKQGGVKADDSENNGQRQVLIQEDEEESEEEEETDEEEEDSEEEEDDESYDEEDESIIIEGEDGIDMERQSGDGEEQPDGESVDDDEDKKNPAYVPKRGAFYEHDMRISMDEQEEEEKKPKKKLWKDEGKWHHDRYNESMQAPKTRAELYNIYGYDITRSDKPPEAPPRSNRARGPRSKQKSRFQDYIPEGDYIQTRNSYNSMKSGGRQGYDENGRGGRGFSRRGGDSYQKRDRYRNDNSYDNRNRGYNRPSHGDFNNREDFPDLGYKEKPRRYDEGRGFQNDRRNDQEYQSRGERASQERDYRGGRDNRGSSERDNRSYHNRDNSEQVRPERTEYENRSNKDNRLSVERTVYHREERASPEQEGRPYNDNYRRGRGYRGGRGNRRPGNRKPEPERNFPPRFQRMKQNMAAAEDDPSLQQGPGGEDEIYMSPPVSPAEGKQDFPPPPPRENQPQVAPIAESQIVQNVGERKSYSKERRVKSGRAPEEPPPSVPEETVPPEAAGKQEDVIQSQQFDNKTYSKQDQGGKPKRYSSQRQRNMPDVGYVEQSMEGQKFYPPDTVFIKGPLSNFFLCAIKWDNKHFTSAEHAYQISKAIFHNRKELAEEMRKAETANKVKMLSKSIKPSDQWMKTRCRLMKDLLIEKFKQVEAFRTALLATDNKPLAHDVVNLFWGTGRNFNGQNMFGKLLMEVRDQARAQMSNQGSFPAHPTPAMLRPPIATVAFPINAVPSGAMSTPQHIFPGNQPAPMTTQVQMIPSQFSNNGVLYAAAPNFPAPPVAMAGFPPPANHPPALATHQQGYPSPPGTQPASIGAQQSPTQAGQQELFRNQTVYYPPEFQMRGPRSTPKRAKAAIPIVNPKEVKREPTKEGQIEEEHTSQEELMPLEGQVPYDEQVSYGEQVRYEEQVSYEDEVRDEEQAPDEEERAPDEEEQAPDEEERAPDEEQAPPSDDSPSVTNREDVDSKHNLDPDESPSGSSDILKTEDSNSDKIVDSNIDTVSEDVSESDGNMDKTKTDAVEKTEPGDISTAQSGDIKSETSVENEDAIETVEKEGSENLQIKTETQDPEYDEAEKTNSVESSVKVKDVKEEEENASDNESFADAEDELQEESPSTQELKEPNT